MMLNIFRGKVAQKIALPDWVCHKLPVCLFCPSPFTTIQTTPFMVCHFKHHLSIGASRKNSKVDSMLLVSTLLDFLGSSPSLLPTCITCHWEEWKNNAFFLPLTQNHLPFQQFPLLHQSIVLFISVSIIFIMYVFSIVLYP